VERGNVEEVGLQEVRGLDGGVVRRGSLKRGDGRENRGMVDEVLVRGDTKKSLLVGFQDGAPLVVVVMGTMKNWWGCSEVGF